MPFPTRCQCDYFINAPAGKRTALTTAMAAAAIPADLNFLALNASKVFSDVTSVQGIRVRRRIILDINQPPLLETKNNGSLTDTSKGIRNSAGTPLNFQGSIVSTSANDKTAVGTGDRQLTLTFFNAAGGGPFTDIVQMNGKTPVPLGVANGHWRFTAVNLDTVGVDQANDGVLTIFENTDGTGRIIATVPASHYTQWSPLGNVKIFRWQEWMERKISMALGSIPVVSIDPVLF